MLTVSREDIERRIQLDNPWWKEGSPPIVEAGFKRRIYFSPFARLALDTTIRRATVLLGPRRVGKTVLVKQLVDEAINSGFDRERILYVSIDTPAYAGISLEKFIEFLPKEGDGHYLIIFDEIQYLTNWEVHLKDLVDAYKGVKFVATGSAAAALKLQSIESGAGRFTDFILPPLTFHEFLLFTDLDEKLFRVEISGKRVSYVCSNIDALNEQFINYLNYGGYPEVVLSSGIRDDADRFVKNDIIDKVLLKDLPSLYGIQNIQELNKLFSVLAYNTGGEMNLQSIAQESGLSKPTISKYLTYLESAFLIIKVSTVSDTCRSLTRERNFKVYLNNPSMRAALFSPVTSEEPDKIGHLCEAAIFSQWQHSIDFDNLRYARWNGGEVDMVYLDKALQKPYWAGEIKWSDRIHDDSSRMLRNIRYLQGRNKAMKSAFITSRTVSSSAKVGDITARIIPSAVYCYTVGRNITSSRLRDLGREILDEEED
jgi:predicted AAA+ superfamily ATPase